MSNIDFPSSPSVNDEYTFNGRTWVWNGSGWEKKTFAAGQIVNADINASAAIVDTKLATISTAGKVSNSATTATSANTASAIVTRDGSGNFTAGTITAALSGNASTATTLTTTRTLWGRDFNGSANVTGALSNVGNITPATDDTSDLGSPSLRFANVYTGDLHLKNDRGDYTIVEEEDALTLHNNKTGKVYNFVLEERKA